MEMEGNVFPWTSQRWELNGEVRWTTVSKNDICNAHRRILTFFPNRYPLKSSLKLCRVRNLVNLFINLNKILIHNGFLKIMEIKIYIYSIS